MNGILGGSSLMQSGFFADWSDKSIDTPFGNLSFKEKENTIFIQRHGDPHVPPHRINHKGNIHALKNLGVSKVVAINSVGSLKTGIKPGTFVVPDDFISPWVTHTFYENEIKFTVPEMDKSMLEYVYKTARSIGLNIKKGGVYIQTIGPRLETKAEINLLKQYGHVVGMTMASEATLCMEYKLPYASICSIDNYCNGILKTPLTIEEINLNWQKNVSAIELFIKTLLERNFK